MNHICRLILLIGLVGGAFFNVFSKYDALSKGGLISIFICYVWIFYNFYACFFSRAILGPPNISALPVDENKYFQFIFTFTINGGLYIGLFFI